MYLYIANNFVNECFFGGKRRLTAFNAGKNQKIYLTSNDTAKLRKASPINPYTFLAKSNQLRCPEKPIHISSKELQSWDSKEPIQAISIPPQMGWKSSSFYCSNHFLQTWISANMTFSTISSFNMTFSTISSFDPMWDIGASFPCPLFKHCLLYCSLSLLYSVWTKLP